MKLGGVILASGMVLNIAHGDYKHGSGAISFTLLHVIGVDHGWVTLDGDVRPSAVTPWASRRIQVRVSALRRSLGII